MIIKLINKSHYKLKIIFRQFFYYFRFFKNNRKKHWNVKNFENYDEYISFQKETPSGV